MKMSPLKHFQILIYFSVFSSSFGSRILFLLPLASRSHVHVFEPLIRGLGERGHDIVNISPIKSPDMPVNVKQLQLITVDDLLGQLGDPFSQRKQGILKTLFNSSTFDVMKKACSKSLEHPQLHELLEKDKFDLVIVDILPNYCMLGVVAHFNAPSIIVTTLAAPSFTSAVVGNKLPPSFVPCLSLGYADKMSFKQRFINTLVDSISSVLWNLFAGEAESLYKNNLPNGKDLPGIDEVLSNTSMLFMNSHFTLTYPRPMLPDVVEVGGMHIQKRPPQELSKDLEEFLAGSGKDGFIFFSLGSIVKAKDMPEEYRKVFVNVFSKLKQRVLWKWETETMPDLPPNVKLSKWLPQQDILAHPNIRLFMTHGGLLSTQESVFYGVPVLGLPVFADQDLNIQQAEAKGYAKFVEIIDIKEETLESAISDLLNEPRYAQNAKMLSKLVQDLPETPLEKAIFWTEYVLRHKGAPQLRSAARNLNFFQYYVLDVVAVMIVTVVLTAYLTFCCCRSVCRKMCRSGHLKKD